MKKLNILLIIFLSIGFGSCEPDVANEGITMEPINFDFKIINTNDSTFKQSDTIIFESIAQNINFNNGICKLGFYISHSDSLPQTESIQSHEVYNEKDYFLILEEGNIIYNNSIHGLVLGLENTPFNKQINYRFKFIPRRKGLFVLGFSPSFYENRQVKARTCGYFDVSNHYWNYYQVPHQTIPSVGSEEYRKYFFIAVTD